MFSRAWRYIIRKKAKSLIMLLVMFAISTLLFSGIAVKKASDMQSDNIDENIGVSFSIRNNLQYNLGTQSGRGNVPAEMINNIEAIDGVNKCVRKMTATARMNNALLVEKPESYGPYGQLMEEEYRNAVMFYGTSNSSLDSLFLMDSIELCKGRHLTENDCYVSLIHEDFAKENGFDIGDKLIFSPFEGDYDNHNPAQNPVETEIVGFFKGENTAQVSYADELNENIIMTDLQTVYTLYGVDENNAIYEYATFFTESETARRNAMTSALNTDGDWLSFELLSDSQKYKALSDSALLLGNMVDKLLIATFSVTLIVITLVIFLWIRERTHETGIFMSLGISKASIVFQYIAELAMITVVAIALAFFASKGVAQYIGNSFVESSSQSAVETAVDGAGGMLGADAETQTLIKTVDNISVNVKLSDVIVVFALQMAVVFFAVCVCSIPLFKLKPRQILSKLS